MPKHPDYVLTDENPDEGDFAPDKINAMIGASLPVEIVQAVRRQKKSVLSAFESDAESPNNAMAEARTRWRRLMDCDKHKEVWRFFEAYMRTGRITKAYKLAGISGATHYSLMSDTTQVGEDYRWMVALCERIVYARAIDRAKELGITGRKVYKYGKDGKPLLHPECYMIDPETGDLVRDKSKPYKPYFEVVFSEPMLAKLLSYYEPSRWAARTDVTSGGEPLNKTADDRAMEERLKSLTPEELEQYLRLESKLRGSPQGAEHGEIEKAIAPQG